MKYAINNDPSGNFYLTEQILNYRCKKEEQNGEGPGSCGGMDDKESNDNTKMEVSNFIQEKNIQEGKHPSEPTDSWKKNVEKLDSGVYKKGNTYRMGENSATVTKGEKMAFAVVTNGELKREFSTEGQARFAAETYAKTGKYPEKPNNNVGSNEPVRQVLKNVTGNMKYVPAKNKEDRNDKFPPLRYRKK